MSATAGSSPSPVPGAVSICIPAYNCGELVERSLKSVEAQTVRPLEIVVVDDGSRDGRTPQILDAIAASGRIVLVRQANAGLSGARNAGFRAARGEWVVPLDADDELDPRAIELAKAAVDAVPGSCWCVSDIVRVAEDGTGEEVFRTQLPAPPTSGWLPAMLERNFVERTVLLRRDTVLALGGYDPAFRTYEDWELSIRMLQAGLSPVYAPGALYRYIKTAGSITSNWPRLLAAYEQLFARHHRPLAQREGGVYRRILARRLWGLARDFMDRTHDPVRALRCAAESVRWDFDPLRLARVALGRLGGRGGR